ncbi:MAG: type Z 30S ribosomal protein S14 [Candidatus Absconditabacteria bacterium]
MARKALIVKQQRLNESRLKSIQDGKQMPNSTKYYNRCKVCGRPKSYIREYGICRVCFRRYAREGLIMGVRKASW